MKTTENLGLKKPDVDDFYNIDDQNDNMDIIDEKMRQLNKELTANNLDVSGKVLPTGTNVDDLREAGVYYFIQTNLTYGLPNNSVNGWLIVLRYVETVVKQLFFRQGTTDTNDFEVYVRSSDGETTWGEWRCFATKNPSGALLLATENPAFTGNGVGNLELRSTAGTSPYMSFHRPNSYAVHLGLGSGVDDLCIGGWSAGAVQYPLLHSGNYTNYAPKYEKGTFSPTFLSSPSSLKSTKAAYIRIGNVVHISMSFEYSSAVKVNTEMGGGIIGLPFKPIEDGPTETRYPCFVTTSSFKQYSGLASYEIFISEGVYGVYIGSVVEDDSIKTIKVYGSYETNS